MSGPSPDIGTFSLNAPTFVAGITLSDHRNYWNFGFDAIMVTDTAFYRNRAYHTTGDTPERLDYVRMASVVEGVYYGILDLAR